VKIQAHPDAKLSHTQLEELAERLASKRHDLLDAQTTLNQQIAAKDDSAISDAAEAAIHIPFLTSTSCVMYAAANFLSSFAKNATAYRITIYVLVSY